MSTSPRSSSSSRYHEVNKKEVSRMLDNVLFYECGILEFHGGTERLIPNIGNNEKIMLGLKI